MIAGLGRYLANRIIALGDRAPDFIIGGADDPYLCRWFLIPRNRLFNVYLHLFIRDDDDRALHDHPWLNASILLRGQYVEHTIAAGGVNRRRRYRAGSAKLRLPSAAHRVELVGREPCWSLFLTGPRVREWGFHCPNGWRHWEDFTTGPGGALIGKGCDE